ncbi:MAG: AmmeMemoRadiSam system protein B [Firmicutes bacterium]|nr:AmmeMemoRadiSam system protein B [Bacillota bacterium]
MKIKRFVHTILMLAVFLVMPPTGCSAVKTERRTENMPENKSTHSETKTIRYPVVNGQFYEGNEEKLKKDIAGYMEHAQDIEVPGDLIGLMEPHAGYIYSGPIAAYGYKKLKGKKYDTVIILAPSHRARFSGVSIMKEGIYRTPLGDVQVDEAMAKKISDFDPKHIRYVEEAEKYEHSLEVQVPFLQENLEPGWKIVPMVYGTMNLDTCRMVAEAIAPNFDPKKCIIIASSDMSHYHSYDEACKMDKPALEKVEKIDLSGLAELLDSDKAELCGIGPVISLMMLTRYFGGEAKILKYANSGDTAGSKGQVVGYGCVAFYTVQPIPVKETSDNVSVDFVVSDEEKKMLLEMARKTLEEKLLNNKDVSFDQPNPLLDKKLGLFVTLRKHGDLRGCIGHCFPVKELRYALPELALSSAFQDPRFYPVKKEELKDINIEISLLSPMKRITDYNEIKIPGHGVYVKKGFRSGVFLPQVADETGWDRETFMAHLCRDKAGLAADEWKKSGTELYIFTVVLFEEPHEK